MSFANYLEEKLLNYLLCNGAFTRPTVYVGASTADPGEDASGLAEPAESANYGRIPTSPTTDWDSWAAGIVDNTGVLSFSVASASWGLITHVCMFDAQSVGAGNLLMSQSLSVAKTVTQDDQLKFNAGNLDVTLD